MYLLCAQCFQHCVAGSSVGSSIITRMCVFAVCARHFQRCVAGSSVSSSIITRMCVFAVYAQRFQRCVAGRQLEQQHSYHNVCRLCARNVFSAVLLAAVGAAA